MANLNKGIILSHLNSILQRCKGYADTKVGELASTVQEIMGDVQSSLTSLENNKVDKDGAALTGTPTAPTAAEGNNSTQIATTAFVKRAVDAGYLTLHQDISGKVNKSGDTMTGKLSVPQVETGEAASSYFQARKFRGEGNADKYYHAIDFGYANHDQVDFHEYGGRWNFYKNQKGAYNTGVLIGSITTNGWEGSAKLTGTPTAPTAAEGNNSTQIATTAFVKRAVDAAKITVTDDGNGNITIS